MLGKSNKGRIPQCLPRRSRSKRLVLPIRRQATEVHRRQMLDVHSCGSLSKATAIADGKLVPAFEKELRLVSGEKSGAVPITLRNSTCKRLHLPPFPHVLLEYPLHHPRSPPSPPTPSLPSTLLCPLRRSARRAEGITHQVTLLPANDSLIRLAHSLAGAAGMFGVAEVSARDSVPGDAGRRAGGWRGGTGDDDVEVHRVPRRSRPGASTTKLTFFGCIFAGSRESCGKLPRR